MKKIYFIAPVFLIIIFTVLPIVKADGDIDATLKKARLFVDKKSYQEALAEYAKIKDFLYKDIGLLIEYARVYTYADMHPEAIALFEEIRTIAQDKAYEFLPELADQYKWNGEIKKSIEIYKTSLKKDSSNIRVKLGLAEALSWQDKLEEANNIYNSILKAEPQNLSAKNAIARNTTWQGYNKLGIKLSREVLATYPDDPDAMENIAHSYYWSGFNKKAIDMLETLLAKYPERKEAKDLYGKIGSMKKLHINQKNNYSSDSNNLDIVSNSVHTGQYIDNTTVLGATYSWYLYRQPGKTPVNGNKYGLDMSKLFNDYVKLDTYLYMTQYDFKNYEPFTTNTWMSLYPSDLFKFYIGYDRETFDDIDALKNEIIVNSGSFSVDFKPNRFWFCSLKYKHSRYSDDNSQNTYFGKIEYRIHQKPYLKAYYNFYYSDWKEQFSNGYFNPESITSNVLGIYGSKDLSKKLFIEAQASIGYETQEPKSDHPTYFGALGLNYRLSSSWMISLRADYFKANDHNPSKDYSKKTAWLNFTYSFGAEPEKPYQSTQPQRPTGQ